MSRNTSLFIRIGEAKNLPIKDLTGSSDPYCVLKVDNEQVARTSTIWKSLCPFWGEEFTLHLPNGFHQLSIYIYDEDLISGDDVMGKVTLTKDVLQSETKGFEKWYRITEIDKNEEIQGEIHLEIGRCTVPERRIVRIKVLEARDLAAKDPTGCSDPYVVVHFLDQQLQTHVIKTTRYPAWNKTLEFELPASAQPSDKITVNVWDWDRVGTDDFMGQVEFKLSELNPNRAFNQWFRLLPKSVDEKSAHSDQKDIGTIRIKVRLSEERILPSQYYRPLLELLIDSVSLDKHRMSGPSPLKIIQEVSTLDLMELAQTLVKVYLGQGKVTSYLDVICAEEIQNTSRSKFI